MRYALAIALMLSLSFGLITESFRYQSTARLFEDDYDLLFDPARIPEIEGSRLWTSLSNFVTGGEEMFINGSQPYILIGGMTNLNNYYPGAVYDRRSSKIAEYTGLDDPFGNEMYGEGEITIIDWDDLDGNGVYDYRTQSTETRSAYDAIQDNNFYVGLGSKMNNLRIGLGFMRNSYQSTLTDPNNNFTWDYEEEDLNTNSLTIRETADFGGDNIYKLGENDIIFSIWSDRQNMSIGFTAEYDMISWTDEALILGDSALWTDPSDTTVDYTTAHIEDSTFLPQSGSNIALELKSFYNYNANAQGRFYMRFFMRSHSYDSDAMEYFFKAREDIYADFLWDTTTTVKYYEGEGNSKGIRAGTKQLFSISERLKFGIGFFFSMSSIFDSTMTRDTTVEVEVYDDNDGISNDPDDYVETIWSSEVWTITTTGSVNSFAVPVGVEFYLAKPLVFRLGAQHTLSYNDFTTVTNLDDYEPERTRLVLGDGTTTETMIDPDPMPVGSEEIDTYTLPVTNYYYGLGWQVTKNLQIDLMGFNELTDLSNWRLSAMLKFD